MTDVVIQCLGALYQQYYSVIVITSKLVLTSFINCLTVKRMALWGLVRNSKDITVVFWPTNLLR